MNEKIVYNKCIQLPCALPRPVWCLFTICLHFHQSCICSCQKLFKPLRNFLACFELNCQSMEPWKESISFNLGYLATGTKMYVSSNLFSFPWHDKCTHCQTKIKLAWGRDGRDLSRLCLPHSISSNVYPKEKQPQHWTSIDFHPPPPQPAMQGH